MIYKQIFDIVRQQVQQNAILRVTDNAFIPFDPANTDYANFKKEVLAGAELQDADGNVMTQEQANAFIATLP
jgi:uncharacterized protein YjbI with pentapeptide repeats